MVAGLASQVSAILILKSSEHTSIDKKSPTRPSRRSMKRLILLLTRRPTMKNRIWCHASFVIGCGHAIPKSMAIWRPSETHSHVCSATETTAKSTAEQKRVYARSIMFRTITTTQSFETLSAFLILLRWDLLHTSRVRIASLEKQCIPDASERLVLSLSMCQQFVPRSLMR
jgi:hypothetical protein